MWKVRTLLLKKFSKQPYRLCVSAVSTLDTNGKACASGGTFTEGASNEFTS